MTLIGILNVSPVCNATSTRHTALKVFSERKEGHSIRPTQREGKCMDAQFPDSPCDYTHAK